MSPADLLASFLDHLHARIRAGGGRAALPAPLDALAREQPAVGLALVVDALREAETPEVVRVIGDGLLETLLNESSNAIATDVAAHLRKNKRFRQAFAFGEHTSVDPALLGDWNDVLQSLGTSKKAERRGLWSKRAQ
jgi:hypothetical protein